MRRKLIITSLLPRLPKTIRAKAKKSLVTTCRRTLTRRRTRTSLLLVAEKKIKVTRPPR